MTISTDDLKPGDVFQDKHGAIWVVEFWCRDPTVKMRQVFTPDAQPTDPQRLYQEGGVCQDGGVNGLMWDGFKKIASSHVGRDSRDEALK